MPPKQSRGRSHARNQFISNAAANAVNEEPFTPAPDASTFRDLLIFEERLKQNAARLQSRKRKYELLLTGFLAFILYLSYFVVLYPRRSVFFQYTLAAVLMICLMTLFLFFASGMHAERIRSANKFVPQANRSLRGFNMYLNTKTMPRSRWRSFLSWTKQNSTSTSLPSMVEKAVARSEAQSSSSTSNSSGGSLKGKNGGSGASTPRRAALTPIPPSQNSRGELIFSNKVSPEFREGYERYRAAFERRRAEKMAAKRAQSWKRWLDWFLPTSQLAPLPALPDKTHRRTRSRHLSSVSETVSEKQQMTNQSATSLSGTDSTIVDGRPQHHTAHDGQPKDEQDTTLAALSPPSVSDLELESDTQLLDYDSPPSAGSSVSGHGL